MTEPQNDFSLDDLVTRLRTAAKGENARAEVKELLQQAVEDPSRIQAGMPDFAENDVILFEDETVSIWHCRFMPGFSVPAHDHQMTATIGVYRGAERNDFYQPGQDGDLEKKSEVILSEGKVLQIGPNAIHAVGCASEDPCCGIHVYLGELTTVERSLFDTQTGEQMSFSDKNYDRLTRADEGAAGS